MKLSVGRIVHYHQSSALVAWPAIVTYVGADGTIDLCVFRRGETFEANDVREAPGEAPRAGCWNWPPRVEG